MELVILTLTGCDQAPLRGQQPEKPPALPEDRYSALSLDRQDFGKLENLRNPGQVYNKAGLDSVDLGVGPAPSEEPLISSTSLAGSRQHNSSQMLAKRVCRTQWRERETLKKW